MSFEISKYKDGYVVFSKHEEFRTKYVQSGGSTDIGKRAKSFMDDTEAALYGRIKKSVPEVVKQITVECMERYSMGLYDSFKLAAREWADKRTKLYKAWYVDDFREYIPSAYIPEYLDFNKYPLAY